MFSDSKKLSREQRRVLDNTMLHGMHIAASAISLVEIAFLGEGRHRLVIGLRELFHQIETDSTLRIVPFTTDVLLDAAALSGSLRDPGDCIIVATARTLNVPLLTSDQRIIDSDLVDIID